VHLLVIVQNNKRCTVQRFQIKKLYEKIGILLNNQPDALIIPNLFCYKTLHVSDIFSSPHEDIFYCTFGTGKFHAGFDDRFQAESGWMSSMSSSLTLLGRGRHKPA
jgi:hypothetical protein